MDERDYKAMNKEIRAENKLPYYCHDFKGKVFYKMYSVHKCIKVSTEVGKYSIEQVDKIDFILCYENTKEVFDEKFRQIIYFFQSQ